MENSKNSLLRRVLWVVLTVFLTAAVIGALYLFTDIFDLISPPGRSSGVLMHSESELPTPFSVEILRYNDIESEKVRSWIDENAENGFVSERAVYYTMYHNDFESAMEMFLYMPLAGEIFGDISVANIRGGESGNALVLVIDSVESSTGIEDGKDLILHIFPTRESVESDLRTERLYVDGVRYFCLGASFTDLTQIRD